MASRFVCAKFTLFWYKQRYIKAKCVLIWAPKEYFDWIRTGNIFPYSFRNDNSKIILGINRIPIYKNNRINSSTAAFVNDVNKLPG